MAGALAGRAERPLDIRPMPALPPWPRHVWRRLLWLQCLLVSALMLWPRPPAGMDLIGWDKANHALAFAGPALAGLLGRRQDSLRSAALLLAALLAWGGGLELLQSLLPPRQGDWADLAADAVGLLLGALAYAATSSKLRPLSG
jgi:VanZ family protein